MEGKMPTRRRAIMTPHHTQYAISTLPLSLALTPFVSSSEYKPIPEYICQNPQESIAIPTRRWTPSHPLRTDVFLSLDSGAGWWGRNTPHNACSDTNIKRIRPIILWLLSKWASSSLLVVETARAKRAIVRTYAVVLKALWKWNQILPLSWGINSRNMEEWTANGMSTPHAIKAIMPWASQAFIFRVDSSRRVEETDALVDRKPLIVTRMQHGEHSCRRLPCFFDFCVVCRLSAERLSRSRQNFSI